MATESFIAWQKRPEVSGKEPLSPSVRAAQYQQMRCTNKYTLNTSFPFI